MLPFSVDKMMIEMNHNMEIIKNDTIKWKFKFCNDFEKEMKIEVGEYSHSVFDYLFNLFLFKQAFDKEDFRKYVQEFKNMDFKNAQITCRYISEKYNEFVIKYKKHFMDYFGFKHEDPLYMQRKIESNRKEIYQKMVEYY
jgi:hypothetical protein